MRNLLIWSIISSFITVPVFAKTLIVEKLEEESNYDREHGQLVQEVACDQRTVAKCPVVYSKSLYDSGFQMNLHEFMPSVSVVNFSFGFSLPTVRDNTFTTEGSNKNKPLNKYRLRKEFLSGLIDSNPDKLFVVAAGNGVFISNMLTPHGAPIGSKFKLYPAQWNRPNTLKVTAVDFTPQGSYYKRAPYANYGIDHVDVAAPVVFSDPNKSHVVGTSFASPWVAKIADELFEVYPRLRVEQVKEILLKSCDVKNIKSAVVASQERHHLGEESKLYKAMYGRKRKNRELYQKEIGDIVLVKSGGVVVPSLVKACAQNYGSYQFESIEKACLEAHKQSGKTKKYLELLKQLWALRKI